MRALNVFMRPVLSLPFRTPMSGQLMLVEITGRKSGRIYKQPVSYVRDGGTLLTPGGGNWKLNLREDRTNRLHFKGKWLEARPDLVTDTDTVTQLLIRMQAASPRTARFIPVLNRDGSVDRTVLEHALANGFLIVRWHPESGPWP
jgi:deazaflavin-dependent oxidoreductase (nitroreductase family)